MGFRSPAEQSLVHAIFGQCSVAITRAQHSLPNLVFNQPSLSDLDVLDLGSVTTLTYKCLSFTFALHFLSVASTNLRPNRFTQEPV